MKIQAKNNFIIIRLEKENKSGIITIKTEQYNEKDEWLKTAPALVVSVGPDVKDVKIGDRILVGATRAARYDYLSKLLDENNADNVTYLAAKEEDIVAVLN